MMDKYQMRTYRDMAAENNGGSSSNSNMNLAHILIVEDEPDIADVYKRLLQRDIKHQIEVTGTGEGALDIYKRDYLTQPFHAIFLDYKLAGKLNGVDVAVEVLRMNDHQRIVFVTAYENEVINEVNHRLGIEGFDTSLLRKPVSSNTLIAYLDNKDLYTRLAKNGVDISAVKRLSPTRQQLNKTLDAIESLIAGVQSRNNEKRPNPFGDYE